MRMATSVSMRHPNVLSMGSQMCLHSHEIDTARTEQNSKHSDSKITRGGAGEPSITGEPVNNNIKSRGNAGRISVRALSCILVFILCSSS